MMKERDALLRAIEMLMVSLKKSDQEVCKLLDLDKDYFLKTLSSEYTKINKEETK